MKNIDFIMTIHRTEWQINLVDGYDENLLMEDGHYHCGITDNFRKKIYINKDLDKQTFDNVVLHELTHAFIESYGFLQVKWEDENVADFVAYYSFEIAEKYDEVIKEIATRGDEIEILEKKTKVRLGK